MKKANQKVPKVIYYTDELNDDFANTKISKKVVDSKFKYVHKNPIWKFFSHVIYWGVAVPLVWFYAKVLLRIKIVNKSAIKKFRKNKYFLYGNHTGFIDAFTPNLLSIPTRNRIIVSAETVSIGGIKNIVQMLGAIPVPTGTNGMKDFMGAIDHYHKSSNITIYPEAHIWPFFTGIRNFPDTSFAYPVKYNSPVIAFFTAYTEPKGLFKHFRKTNITINVSDPIYPDQTKPRKEAQKKLRDKVYDFMKTCAEKYSTYKVIDYKPTNNIK